MGIVKFFGTINKINITSSSIRSDFKSKLPINHLFLDFNSIVHVASRKLVSDINSFMKAILYNLDSGHSMHGEYLDEKFAKYKMTEVQSTIKKNTSPESIITMFHDHFTDRHVDKLIIAAVINTVLTIIKTYCDNSDIQTLLIAIDGVPSKGKLVEQRQRRYTGAIVEETNKKILAKYQDTLLAEKGFLWLANNNLIMWSRNKITPGTAFMHKMVNYLKSDRIIEKFKQNRPAIDIIISDMYETGEGEKKIVNYVEKYLKHSSDNIMVYSPDADVILLCILMNVPNVYMLRFDQQQTEKLRRNTYDLIDIKVLKENISYYINNHPDYVKSEFEINRINNDIVCISSLFGNDFVPKIETINVDKGFQKLLDAYLQTLLKLKDKKYYLVKKSGDSYKLNFTFLKTVIKYLLPEENDFIKYNDLYNQYINIGQIKNVFDYLDISQENLVKTYNSFMSDYGDLKNLVKNNGNYSYFLNNDLFMKSLKKCIVITSGGQAINTTGVTNKELISLIKKYYYETKQFPYVNINLNMWSHSIRDKRHNNEVKEKKMNAYDKERYQFEKMLDQYYIKFNAQPLQLSESDVDNYYKEYFGIKLASKGKLTDDANQVMHDYMEGILWVFNYYFNDNSYVNRWYYKHERAPLLTHLSMFMENISLEYFNDVFNGLDAYKVDDLSEYFNPVEQLIYVSPMTPDIIKLLPVNYQEYLMSDDKDKFLDIFLIDTQEITNKMWKQSVCTDIDCKSIPYFNKCLLKAVQRPTEEDDISFLAAIRKVEDSPVSIRRSQNTAPDY